MANKSEPTAAFDFTRYLADYKVPGIDLEGMVASQRKNLDALSQANRLAVEGMQAVMRRQAEILRQTIEEVANAGKDLAGPGSAPEKAARQTELAKEALERAIANMRELSEMVARSNQEAFELLNRRFAQNLDELRDMLLKMK